MNRASIKVWIFCLFFLPVTLKLGFWQLDRAEEKQLLLDRIEQRANQQATTWKPANDVRRHTYKPYRLEGFYQGESFLLDNRIRDGQVGYEVLSVFELISGDKLLVNRGWVKAGQYRQELPAIDVPAGSVSLRGYFYLPEGEIPVLKDIPFESGWPKRIQQIRWQEIENSLNAKLITQSEFRLADDNQAGHYRTGWPKTAMLPAKHIGYATQWFALAFALVVLTILATIKLQNSKNNKRETL